VFEIIADTKILFQQASRLAKLADRLDDINEELGLISNSINPSAYDGKFKRDGTIFVNDPWTGQADQYSHEAFMNSWRANFGSNMARRNI
jgi:hypothetical protein